MDSAQPHRDGADHDDVVPTPQGDGDPGTEPVPEPPPDPDVVQSNMDLPGMDAPESLE